MLQGHSQKLRMYWQNILFIITSFAPTNLRPILFYCHFLNTSTQVL